MQHNKTNSKNKSESEIALTMPKSVHKYSWRYYTKASTELVKKGWKSDRFWTWLVFSAMALLLLVVAFYFVFMPSRHLDLLSQARASLQGAADDLNGLQEPSLIEIGQKDTTLKFQTEQLTRIVADDIQPEPLPPIWSTNFNLWRSPVKLTDPPGFADVVGRYDQTIKDINSLYMYHLGVLTATSDVFSLNPLAEFTLINPGSDTVKQKADETIKDLNDINQQLARIYENSQTQDAQAEKLLELISELAAVYETFKTDRNLASLSNGVNTIQKRLVDNRQTFWSESKSRLNESMASIDSDLARIELGIGGLVAPAAVDSINPEPDLPE